MNISKYFTIDELYVKDIWQKQYNENNEKKLLKNFIQSAAWRCDLIDLESGIKDTCCGVVHFPYPTKDDEFLEYGQLNQSIVMDWVKNHPDVNYHIDKVISKMEIKISNQKHTKIAEEHLRPFSDIPSEIDAIDNLNDALNS